LSIGTSNVVEPAASLPWMAASHGATVIVVNPSMEGQRKGPSVLPVEGPAGVMLPRLLAEAFAGRRPRRQEHSSNAPPGFGRVDAGDPAPAPLLDDRPTDQPGD